MNDIQSINSKFTGKKVLVTGGAGFIGSHIVEYLFNETEVDLVRVIDNLSTGYRENLKPFIENARFEFEFIEGDICNFDLCLEVTKDIDFVSHQAALGSVPRSINNPVLTNKNNICGFVNILWASKVNDIKRFVFASSSSVYGDSENLPKVERNIGEPLSPYAITKLTNELYGKLFTNLYGIKCVGLRYFNIFGPRQSQGIYAAVIPIFINNILEGQRSTINGDGNYSRDFTFVANAVQANILSMTTENPEAFGKIFNIASCGRYTIKDLYQTLQVISGSDIPCKLGEVRLGDVPHSFVINKSFL